MVVSSQEALRSFLEAERMRLEATMAQIEAGATPSLGYGNHMADDASEAYEQAKDLALRQNTEQLLIQIRDALAQFDRGTYGVCKGCGKDIDPARLQALPYVTLCLRCQQRQKKS
ncbi:MAG: TraR/DksA C4-type zinc finger protein [Anaerolineae bacterium]|nr:TraR/DksA C4-type zinc finger protein [Anaerolineae bacterium]